MITKALLIAKALYPSYSFVFLFDNIIGYYVYIKDALHQRDMNNN